MTGSAFAESPLQTATESTKVTFEMKSELEYNDRGLQKTDDVDPQATSNIQLDLFRLNFQGKINSKADYRLRVNLLKESSSKVEYGYAKMNFGPAYLLVGKTKINQAGYYQLKSSVYKVQSEVYTSSWKPFSSYQPVIEVGAKVAGEISLQLTDDIVSAGDEDGDGTQDDAIWNTENMQPGWVLAYKGDFNGIKPLLEYGNYDLGHSNFITLGVAVQMMGIDTAIDYTMDNRSSKTPDGDKSKDEVQKISSMVLDLGYEVKGVVKPFFVFSTADIKQSPDDVKGNAAGSTDFGDNQTTMTLGTHILSFGEATQPYISYSSESGDFIDPADADKTESKSRTKIRLGLAAKI
jgi:hypothetical protein